MSGVCLTEPATAGSRSLSGLRLGVDVDGVIVNNNAVWKPYFETYADIHNHPIRDLPHIAPYWDYFYDVCRKCFDHVLHDFDMVAGYPVRKDALETLTALHERGAIITLITSIPADVKAARALWLVSSPLMAIVDAMYIEENKAGLAESLGLNFLIDDAQKNIEQFTPESKCKPIVFDAPYNRQENISWALRAHTWEEIPGIIEKAWVPIGWEGD